MLQTKQCIMKAGMVSIIWTQPKALCRGIPEPRPKIELLRGPDVAGDRSFCSGVA